MLDKIKNFIFDGVADFSLFGRQAAVFSFLVGLVILIIYFLSGFNRMVAFTGLCYLCCAFIANIGVLVFLGLSLIQNQSSDYFNSVLKTVLIILINIPIAVLFVFLALGGAYLFGEHSSYDW